MSIWPASIWRSRRIAVVVASTVLIAALPRAWSQAHAVSINGSVTLVESTQESGAVQRATQDLRNDFSKVFGQQPRLVNSLGDAGPVAILIAQRDHLPAGVPCTTTDHTEAFAFSVVPSQGAKHQQVVCLTGADMRGTIYAIYEFSQSVLGTDPMYLWTDKEPAKRTSIPLPADFARTYPSPVFRYRGFFINDEDLLTGWAPAPKDEQTGISLKAWDNIFETTLRLKGNMIVPGTWIFPDDAQVAAASARGLIVNQHHAEPLGLNAARWPKGVPYNFSTHPEILQRAWKDTVEEYKPGDDILWSVGLRGLSDQSYAALDPSVRDNDPLLGKRISDAIAEQIKIVRARYPNAQFVTDLWMEGDRLKREGYLKIPPEVTQVWADTGYGDMQDGGDVSAGQGAYIHVAMYNGRANQLSELVPVSVLDQQLGRYIKAGATGYLLENTSDIRPVAMTAKAVMDIGWGGVPDTSDPADAYYRQWATEEFGARSASALVKIYNEYFNAPPLFSFPHFRRPAGMPPRPTNVSDVPRHLGDNHYQSEARRLILDYLSQDQVIAMPSQSPKWTEPRVATNFNPEFQKAMLQNDIEQCSSAEPRWDAVWRDAVAAEPLIDPTRRDYYQFEVLTMITINRESNRMLLDAARSLQDKQSGNSAKAETEAADALTALDAIRKSMTTAEYGKWKNWYRGDWLAGIYRTHELVQDYANHLKDPMAKLPAPMQWSGWEAYFHIMEYEDDRSVDVK
ncbi:MAG TPA: glycosyl hydrolase 115 family protein [Terracidiphilus sp.]|nr:glycosyl hydrolase 115 family protein [Terracidiphilus sp.]